MALPLVTALSAEPEFTIRSQRKAKYPVEMRLFAVPPHPGAGLIFGTEHLTDGSPRQAFEGLDSRDQRIEPARQIVRRLEPLPAVVIPPAKGCDTPFSLEGTELKGRQRQFQEACDQVTL